MPDEMLSGVCNVIRSLQCYPEFEMLSEFVRYLGACNSGSNPEGSVHRKTKNVRRFFIMRIRGLSPAKLNYVTIVGYKIRNKKEIRLVVAGHLTGNLFLIKV